MIICVKVLPGARQAKIVGWQGSLLKVNVPAPPQKGQANAALIDLLARHFNLPKSRIKIISGHTSRIKRIEIDTPKIDIGLA